MATYTDDSHLESWMMEYEAMHAHHRPDPTYKVGDTINITRQVPTGPRRPYATVTNDVQITAVRYDNGEWYYFDNTSRVWHPESTVRPRRNPPMTPWGKNA